ncbi:derepression protein [Escherichia coli]|uniref:Derepression protein n=1 Tax=Escherichia coli TaxID=562 RepID=A0A377A889_ECOLX|nr:derepression protein [Escherichia coli]
MANRKQQRAYAARRHIQTEIDRRLTRAAHIAFIMQSKLAQTQQHYSADYCAAVFSYLAEDLLSLQDLVQQQNKLH